jgi:ATP synthase protein I
MSETPDGNDGLGPPTPGDDPWAAFGYLVAGVLFYGVIGWGVSLWLHASYWIPVGILVGAGFGTYMVFNRYRFHGNEADDLDVTDHETPHDVGRTNRPASDDRGETS